MPDSLPISADERIAVHRAIAATVGQYLTLVIHRIESEDPRFIAHLASALSNKLHGILGVDDGVDAAKLAIRASLVDSLRQWSTESAIHAGIRAWESEYFASLPTSHENEAPALAEAVVSL